MSSQDIASHLDKMILAANKVVGKRKDSFIRMHCKLGELILGDEHLTLGALLPGTNGRLSQLKRMVDKAPCGPILESLREVRCSGQISTGLSWADFDDSFTLSIGHSPPWSEISIPCERHTIDELCIIKAQQIHVRNIAAVSHVDSWSHTIEDYGKDFASSSILYKGNGFVMRMHFHDHPPCHVHLYPRPGDTKDLIARLRVDNGDIMSSSSSLSSAMRDEARQVIKDYRNELLEGWANIQSGKLPLKIQ